MSYNKIESGTIFQMGKYSFGANGEVKPLRWAVLNVDKNKGALAVCLNCIDSKKFNDIDEPINWEESSLRKWLNNDFYNIAFSQTEKQQITLASIDNQNLHPDDFNYIYADNSYGSTKDNIFLLSISEYNFYLRNSFLKIRATPYAISKGAYCTDLNNCGWWLRTPAFDNPYEIDYGDIDWWKRSSYKKNDHITFVFSGEFAREDGNYADCTGYGICPAMWVSLYNLENYTDGTTINI